MDPLLSGVIQLVASIVLILLGIGGNMGMLEMLRRMNREFQVLHAGNIPRASGFMMFLLMEIFALGFILVGAFLALTGLSDLPFSFITKLIVFAVYLGILGVLHILLKERYPTIYELLSGSPPLV